MAEEDEVIEVRFGVPGTPRIPGEIPDFLRERVRDLVSLPEDKLRAINEWVRSRLEILTEDEPSATELQAGADQLKIPRSRLYPIVGLMRALLLSRAPSGVLSSIFTALGAPPDTAEKAKLLIQDLTIPADKADYARQKVFAIRLGLPALEDVDVFCDLRAVFRRYPSPSRSEAHQKNIRSLMGLEPLAIVTLKLKDSTEDETTCIFQLTEKNLNNLVKTLTDAQAQIAILSDARKTLKLPRGEAE